MATTMLVRERPPMRLMHLATTPSGKTYRWGEDEPGAENCFEDLQDSDSVPGGDKEWSCSLPRKPHVDYADMQRGTRIRQYGVGRDRALREFRLQDAPKSSGDRLVMDPAALGYQAHLSDDESAQEIFIDGDQSAWVDSSTQRRADSNKAGYPIVASASRGFADKGAMPSGVMFDFTNVTAAAGRNETGEQCYYGGGVDIGQVMSLFKVLAGPEGDATWADIQRVSVDDVISTYLDSANLADTSQANPTVLEASGAGYKYAFLISSYTGGFGGGMNNVHAWLLPKVIGRHGCPIYGTWPNIGVLASDAIAYALAKWAPLIDFSTGANGSIRPTTFPIPHLPFKDLTTVMQMVESSNRFELNEWAVWPGQRGPTFHLNPRGEREGRKRWRVRSREAQLKETGGSFDASINAVVVQWQDFDGSTRIVGPTGSGFSVTDSRLIDLDPLNPANQIPGLRKWRKIATKSKGTLDGAIETAERYLEQVKLLDNSGEATITGYVEDEHGMMWPYYYVKSGDLLDPRDSGTPGYRYIVNAGRTRSSRSASLFLDAPPDTREAMLERLDVEELAEGFN